MSYSYSGDPSTRDLDYYRFLIGDTGVVDDTGNTPVETFVLSDEEINFVINTQTVHNHRLYLLFNALAIQYAKEFKNSLGPASEDPTSRLEYFKSQAAHYKKMVSVGSGLSIPVYQGEKIFTKGMHDND
jgi:hypothetical protein